MWLPKIRQIKGLAWPDATLFYFIDFPFIHKIHWHTLKSMNIRRGSSPFLHRWTVSGRHLPGLPSRDANSGPPYSEPTCYQLSHAATLTEPRRNLTEPRRNLRKISLRVSPSIQSLIRGTSIPLIKEITKYVLLTELIVFMHGIMVLYTLYNRAKRSGWFIYEWCIFSLQLHCTRAKCPRGGGGGVGLK